MNAIIKSECDDDNPQTILTTSETGSILTNSLGVMSSSDSTGLETDDMRLNQFSLQNVAQFGKYLVFTNLIQGSNIYTLPKMESSKQTTEQLNSDATQLLLSNIGSNGQIQIPVTIGENNTITIPIDASSLLQHSGSNMQLDQFQNNIGQHLSSDGTIQLQLNGNNVLVNINANQNENLSDDHSMQPPPQLLDHDEDDNMNDELTAVNENIIIKSEKNLFPSHLMDLMAADGSIVKISTTAFQQEPQTQEVNKLLSGEMMKMNYEDLSQFLSYHEVFGKIPNDPLSPSTTVHSSLNGNNLLITDDGLDAIDITDSKNSTLDKISTGLLQEMSNDGKTVHSCDVCGKTFAYQYQLIVHKRYHLDRKPFVCQVCGQAFNTTQELMEHGKSHLQSSMFVCNVCFHVFANDASLERHMKRHSTDKPYSCDLCQKTFARKEHLENHKRIHSGETPFHCQFCQKTFTRKEHKINHERKHQVDQQFKCEICDKSFTRKEHMTNHTLWHSGNSPHICQICGKKYTRKEHLANHYRSHTKETPFKCEICGKSFTRKEHFTSHILWHTGETNHKCDICAKTFTRKEHLSNHVRQHTGESPHKCSYCNKTFTRKEHLVNHIRSHTGETPYACILCPKAFTRKDHLITHNRLHTGESPFKCSYCTKAFSRKEHKTNHERQHTGESPHKCTYCNKTFTRREHLTNHMHTHLPELSPHKCEFCQKTFTRKEHLTNHLKLHENADNPHQCNVCNKPFTRKEILINHMARCHNNEKPFECTFEGCGKSFPLKGNLLFHERSHNKGADAERPFLCELCPKDFICKGHLVSHLRSHTGERSHHCQQPGCSKTFVEKGNLLRHIKKTHPEVGNEGLLKLGKNDGKTGSVAKTLSQIVSKPMSQQTHVIVSQPTFQQQISQNIGSTAGGSSSNLQNHQQQQSISNSINLTSIPVTIISGSNDTHTSTVQIHIQQQHTDQQFVF